MLEIKERDFDENAQVSIIMPAHNAAKFIEISIKSVIEQCYTDWQLIVVNDRSSDETPDIVARYAQQDSRILLVNNTSSVGGAFYARNIALEEAKGRYIAFLDSDDIWKPEKLSKQIEAMKSSGRYASHSSYIRIDEQGNNLNRVKVKNLVTYRDQIKSNRIPNLTGVYDCEKVGIVKQSDIGHEDYDMWLKILLKTPSIGVEEPLAYYRVLSNSLSSNKIKAAVWHYNILKRQKGIGFLKSVFYFTSYIYNAVCKRV
jgi:glycosyltransferase involved in cell wall biosynthesis